MLGVLFLLQTAPLQSCAMPDLCELLQRAEAVNRQEMLRGGGYSASIETESATLSRREWRFEAPTLVEQTAGRARWSEGGYEYHLIGKRGITNAIPLSRMAYLRLGWVVPTLATTRLILITQSGKTSQSETLSGALAPEIVVHPLAEDRDTFYRFSGGSLQRRMIDGVEREVLVVEVTARSDLTQEETLFEGELSLDPESLALVRLLGRFKVHGRSGRGLHMPSFEPGATLVELSNQRLADGSWAPLVQRFEVQSASSHKSGYGTVRRVISRYYDVTPQAPSPRGGGIGASTMGYELTSAPGDSVQSYRAWRARPGDMSESVFAADFGDFSPDRLRLTGRPRFMIQGLGQGDFVRVNRIEGIFTGAALTARLRDAAPGVFASVAGGYAWSEKTARGGVSVGWDTPAWTLEAGAARSLEVTNKFRNQFDNPSLAALFGRDSWDYVDRRGGTLSLTRALEFSHGSVIKLEGARIRDAAVTRHMEKSLVRRSQLRVNRNITPGSYWRGRAVFDWNPEVSPLFTPNGIGLRAEAEVGSGDIDYTRLEGRMVLRKSLAGFFVIGRLHGGVLLADAPPPQQLFELGGPAGLPGYEYKEFAGTRAALLRVRLTRPLGLLDRPVRVSGGFTIPSLSPAISVGFQGGFADAKSAASRAAVRALGDLYDDATNQPALDPATGEVLPASVPTSKLRTSLDVRVGFFGDALAVGLARALESGRKLKLIVAFGRQF